MTDEEKLAERYVNGIPIFAEEGEGFSRTQMQQAFLAGLKAGRPEWHDLRKYKNDLPKEGEDVLIAYSNGDFGIKHLEWNKEWWGNGTYCSLIGVSDTMLVSFEYCNKIIANAELSLIPNYRDTIKIWGKEYEVGDYRQEVEIKQKPSGKKAVIEKIIVTLNDCGD